MTTYIPDNMPDKVYYNCYTIDTTEAAAVEHFRRKFGTPPEKTSILLGMRWVGPVPGKENNNA